MELGNMREMEVHWEEIVNLRRGILGRGVRGSVHVCAENVLNNAERNKWYAELGFTGRVGV